MYHREAAGAYQSDRNAEMYGEGGSMLRDITGFAVFIAILAVLLGVVAARSELLNPLEAQAEALRLSTETRAMSDKNDYQKAAYQIELDKQRVLAQIEVEQKAQRARVLTDGLAWAAFVLPVGVFALLFAAAIHVVCRAAKLISQPVSLATKIDTDRIKPFPADRVIRHVVSDSSSH